MSFHQARLLRPCSEQRAKSMRVLLPFISTRFRGICLDHRGWSAKLQLPFREYREQQFPSLREGALYGHF